MRWLTRKQIEDLKQVLSTHSAQSGSPLPYLPVLNAGQLITARIEYLDFQNGTGVRYLTQFGQDVFPINNADLIYTFQGLTGDGLYQISATFPIQSTDLPSTGNETPYDYWEFSSAFPDYAAGISALLEEESSGSFSPTIDLLDAMLRSLLVSP